MCFWCACLLPLAQLIFAHLSESCARIYALIFVFCVFVCVMLSLKHESYFSLLSLRFHHLFISKQTHSLCVSLFAMRCHSCCYCWFGWQRVHALFYHFLRNYLYIALSLSRSTVVYTCLYLFYVDICTICIEVSGSEYLLLLYFVTHTKNILDLHTNKDNSRSIRPWLMNNWKQIEKVFCRA